MVEYTPAIWITVLPFPFWWQRYHFHFRKSLPVDMGLKGAFQEPVLPELSCFRETSSEQDDVEPKKARAYSPSGQDLEEIFSASSVSRCEGPFHWLCHWFCKLFLTPCDKSQQWCLAVLAVLLSWLVSDPATKYVDGKSSTATLTDLCSQRKAEIKLFDYQLINITRTVSNNWPSQWYEGKHLANMHNIYTWKVTKV